MSVELSKKKNLIINLIIKIKVDQMTNVVERINWWLIMYYLLINIKTITTCAKQTFEKSIINEREKIE